MIKEYIDQLSQENEEQLKKHENQMKSLIGEMESAQVWLDQLQKESNVQINIFSPRTIDEDMENKLKEAKNKVSKIKQQVEYTRELIETHIKKKNEYEVLLKEAVETNAELEDQQNHLNNKEEYEKIEKKEIENKRIENKRIENQKKEEKTESSEIETKKQTFSEIRTEIQESKIERKEAEEKKGKEECKQEKSKTENKKEKEDNGEPENIEQDPEEIRKCWIDAVKEFTKANDYIEKSEEKKLQTQGSEENKKIVDNSAKIEEEQKKEASTVINNQNAEFENSELVKKMKAFVNDIYRKNEICLAFLNSDRNKCKSEMLAVKKEIKQFAAEIENILKK